MPCCHERMASDLVGGRYRLLERHAVGGMAALWRAKDERTGEIVALKRLHPFLITDSTARARLEREASALRALDHHAIIRPRELIDDPDDPALVMDFAEGRSLAERLASDGPMARDEAIAVVGTIAEALAVAHRAGIVHRDVKPANILVEDSGAVHLVDFGIASLDGAGDMTLTATRTMVGTLRYSAPERLAGAKASPRSDVWALGAVLYEMLTGRPAQPGIDATTMLNVPAPDLALDDMPAEVAAILRRAMATDPADRFADAGAFRDALGALEEAVESDADTVVVPLVPPVTGRPRGSIAPRPSMSPVDRAASVFVGAVAVVALVVTAALTFGAVGQATPPITPAPAVVATPVAEDAVASQEPSDDRDEDGRGRGKGKGKGNKD